jgi:hypothetical protein
LAAALTPAEDLRYQAVENTRPGFALILKRDGLSLRVTSSASSLFVCITERTSREDLRNRFGPIIERAAVALILSDAFEIGIPAMPTRTGVQ